MVILCLSEKGAARALWLNLSDLFLQSIDCLLCLLILFLVNFDFNSRCRLAFFSVKISGSFNIFAILELVNVIFKGFDFSQCCLCLLFEILDGRCIICDYLLKLLKWRHVNLTAVFCFLFANSHDLLLGRLALFHEVLYCL